MYTLVLLRFCEMPFKILFLATMKTTHFIPVLLVHNGGMDLDLYVANNHGVALSSLMLLGVLNFMSFRMHMRLLASCKHSTSRITSEKYLDSCMPICIIA